MNAKQLYYVNQANALIEAFENLHKEFMQDYMRQPDIVQFKDWNGNFHAFLATFSKEAIHYFLANGKNIKDPLPLSPEAE